MPWTPEQKKADREKKKQQAAIEAAARAELDKYNELDVAEDYAPGEQFTWAELQKIYFGEDLKANPDKKPKDNLEIVNPSAHEILGQKRTFEEWLEQRRVHRDDLWLLMHTARGTWEESVHRPIANFFVQKDSSTLSFKYTQDQKNKWLHKQDVCHERLLLYPRGFRKSTISILDVVQWIICCPDIVVLVVTSTKTLGKRFIGELRGYFTVKFYDRPTDFQLLYPELCIPEDKGKKSGDVREFRCPQRHLNLKDPTVSFSSMEASSAGVRADVIRFDDAVDELNYKEVESRLSVLSKFDQTRELIIPPYGFWEAVGTRYTDGLKSDSETGAVSDLYGTILQRDKQSEEKTLKILIGAAWEVKSEFQDVPYRQLTSDMVTLLSSDPVGPGSFKVLMKKCSDNETQFRCQQLNQPVADLNDEEAYVNTFTEANIQQAVRNKEYIHTITGPIRRFLFVDTAMTAGRKSDYSAFAVVQVEDRGDDLPPIVWYLEIRADRYSDQQVAEIIPELMQKWNCGAYVEEIPSTGVTFKNEVLRQVYMRGIQHLPLRWFTPSQEPKAKETRIRTLQMLHDQGLLRFILGSWLELMKKQLIGYAGHKPKGKSGRKDDIPDAMSYVYKVLPYIGFQTDEEKKQRVEQEEKDAIDARRRAHYRAMFGDDGPSTVTSGNPSNPPDDRPHNPIGDALRPINERAQQNPMSFNVIRRKWEG